MAGRTINGCDEEPRHCFTLRCYMPACDGEMEDTKIHRWRHFHDSWDSWIVFACSRRSLQNGSGTRSAQHTGMHNKNEENVGEVARLIAACSLLKQTASSGTTLTTCTNSAGHWCTRIFMTKFLITSQTPASLSPFQVAIVAAKVTDDCQTMHLCHPSIHPSIHPALFNDQTL